MTQNWNQFIAQFPISNPSAKMLVDLSHYGIIKVSGPDAIKFLQGQLTCDVNAVQSGIHSLGAYCNIKGKVESLFRLWHNNEEFYLRMIAGLVEPTLQELKKYAVFFKVILENVSARVCGFGVANHNVEITINDPELTVLTITPQKRYEIYGPIKALETAWHSCIAHASHVDPYLWEALDIEDHIPELYPETKSEFFPHDLNLPELQAVSFTKGCFRGQEIIARMQHRGKLKRHLCLFTANNVEECIRPGTIITTGGPEQEAAAGTVVRAMQTVGNKVQGLAVITDSFTQSKLCIGNKEIIVI